MTSETEALTLVLVGPMAAGKTSVGRRVARRLGVAFVDTDKRIAAEHGPIPQIFAEQGEARFRELERAAVATALTEGGVVSLGGGAVTDPGTRDLLKRHPVVFLTVSEESVADRIRGGSRPLLAGEDPLERWKRIFDERRDLYDEVASVTFDTSRRPMQRIADEIVAWRREQR
ncbi:MULTISPECIES: shikimate kinase [unclassified Microbacterium]|uniref:shikimate kinase n=1 Tax=unclassified Microbacterium TaxID=2609290 RepID=UPI000EAA24D4|nr:MULTISPECIES: shikimate kinase [unclassified Microbacterium]MBT2485986.1 shikimate kinase [Microbacterium sp. ISL-108]RKN68731.1 shikimate kinase [Microbacterium sp. CGR2]